MFKHVENFYKSLLDFFEPEETLRSKIPTDWKTASQNDSVQFLLYIWN